MPLKAKQEISKLLQFAMRSTTEMVKWSYNIISKQNLGNQIFLILFIVFSGSMELTSPSGYELLDLLIFLW